MGYYWGVRIVLGFIGGVGVMLGLVVFVVL